MKANVYVDGFNLYYGAVKSTPYRWLNVAAMCRLLLPRDQINQIKYFTALVSPRPHDPGQPTRQQIYLRALRTIPNLTIILGSFLTHEVKMPLAPPESGYVKVVKTEEKGSDVNLATRLVLCLGRGGIAECAEGSEDAAEGSEDAERGVLSTDWGGWKRGSRKNGRRGGRGVAKR